MTTEVQNSGDNSASAAKGKASGTIKWIVALGATIAAGYYVGQIAAGYEPVKEVAQKIGRMFQPAPEVVAVTGPRTRILLSGNEPQQGPNDALVTIIEFSDYECPFCARIDEPLHDAVEKFGDDVRLIFKNYPLPMHPQALPAAQVSAAAHLQGKFWEASHWLFANHADTTQLDALAKAAGLDVEKLRSDMASDAVAKAVDSDRLAGGIAQIHGTPTFVINGHSYHLPPHPGSIAQAIEHELKSAKELVASGVARADVYQKLLERDAAKAASPAQDEPKEPQGAPEAPVAEPAEKAAADGSAATTTPVDSTQAGN